MRYTQFRGNWLHILLYITILGFVIYTFSYFSIRERYINKMISSDDTENIFIPNDGVTTTGNSDTKIADIEEKSVYNILQWSPGRNSPFNHMDRGKQGFIKNKCRYTNCFVTDNKGYLKDLTDYDAIVFNGNEVIFMEEWQLPQKRSPKQKYIFGATESAHNNPACKPVLDNFFNWTWTYRIDSDFRWGYLTVYDLDGTVIGPKDKMNWPYKMDPIDEELKKKLESKTKAAAWFVSHCYTKNKREDFAKKIEVELTKLGLSLDIYGTCGKHKCPRYRSDLCFEMLASDYYFYFAFENSFAPDYVTEKLLSALDNYAVPVVYGSGDYDRFVPPGSYLDAKELGPKAVAEAMYEIINNKTIYHDMFRWRNHFKYKETTPSDDICNLCAALNDRESVSKYSLYENFREWWNVDGWEEDCKTR